MDLELDWSMAASARGQEFFSPGSSKFSNNEVSICLDEHEPSAITLEEFKWNLKRLLHECCPDGIYLHDIEEAYFHWFRKVVCTNIFSNSTPVKRTNDPIDEPLVMDWATVFRSNVQLKQTFVIEIIDDDIYKVKLRPGCIKPEENKIVLALTEYANCKAYMRTHFGQGQGRNNEETEPTRLPIRLEHSPDGFNNFTPVKSSVSSVGAGTENEKAADISVQVEEHGGSESTSASPTKTEIDQFHQMSDTTTRVDKDFKVEETSSTSPVLNNVGSVDSIHCHSDSDPDPAPSTLQALTLANERSETAIYLTDDKDKLDELELDKHSKEDNQLDEPSLISHPVQQQAHLNTGQNHDDLMNENNNYLNIEHSQTENLENGGVMDNAMLQQNGVTITCSAQNLLETRSDSALTNTSDNDKNSACEEEVQTHFNNLMGKHVNGYSNATISTNGTVGVDPSVAEPVSEITTTRIQEVSNVVVEISHTIKKSQKPAIAQDTTPTVLLKDILVNRQPRRGPAILQQTKYRCTYMGCSKYFNTLKERQKHLIDAHALNGLKYKCEVEACRKLFRTREAMLLHGVTCSERVSTNESSHKNNGVVEAEKRNYRERGNTCPDSAVSFEEHDEDRWNSDGSSISSSSSSKRRKVEFPAKCDLNNCDKVIESSVIMNLHRLTNH